MAALWWRRPQARETREPPTRRSIAPEQKATRRSQAPPPLAGPAALGYQPASLASPSQPPIQIAELQEQVDKACTDQTRLEQELDFLSSQQQELEEALTPLEQAVETMPQAGQTHADRERETLFHLTENLDSELRHMLEEVKEAVKYVNSQAKSSESDSLGKISRILGAHLESLQWITQTTQSLQKKLHIVAEDVKLRQQSLE